MTGRSGSSPPDREVDSPPSGHWQVFGERTVYASDRIDVVLADVQEPHGARVPEHHLVRCHVPAAACLVAHPQSGLLLIRRHRFIVGTWGWEIPGGGIEPDEDPADAARREVEEETGWRPLGDVALLVRYHPSSGLLDQTFRCYLATDAEHVGEPTSPGEAAEIRWLQPSVVEELLEAGDVVDGMAVTALYAWLRRFGPPRRA